MNAVDLEAHPPTRAELDEAYAVWCDPTRTDATLVALCGSEDRAGVMLAIAALAATRRCEVVS